MTLETGGLHRGTRWRIRMPGGLRTRCGERVVAHLYSRKAAGLLAYLAFHRGQSHAREDLAELLWPGAEGRGVSMPARLEIVAQIATALAAAHSVGVIHKDVKPSSILIEERPDASRVLCRAEERDNTEVSQLWVSKKCRNGG